MQTFLCYPNFRQSAKVLDRQRLGKQRIEAFQLLKINLELKESPDKKIPWMNHPACIMWRNYEWALGFYGMVVCSEWKRRGYQDSMIPRFVELFDKCLINCPNYLKFPPWVGCEKFHSAHRAALLYKNFDHYKQFGWEEAPRLEYFWPVNDLTKDKKEIIIK